MQESIEKINGLLSIMKQDTNYEVKKQVLNLILKQLENGVLSNINIPTEIKEEMVSNFKVPSTKEMLDSFNIEVDNDAYLGNNVKIGAKMNEGLKYSTILSSGSKEGTYECKVSKETTNESGTTIEENIFSENANGLYEKETRKLVKVDYHNKDNPVVEGSPKISTGNNTYAILKSEKAVLNQNEKTADAMVEAMAQGRIDTNGQPITNTQPVNSRQMGFAKVGLLAIGTVAVSIGIVILGNLLR